MRSSRRGFLSVCLLLTASVAPAAGAQGSSPLAHYHRAERLYEGGDLNAALRAFEQAYAIDPKPRRGDRIGMHFEDYDPAFQLGRLHARLGNFEEAQKYFAQCAAGGYTERSRNAEEYRRWRAVVERALAAAVRPTSVPPIEPSPGRPIEMVAPHRVETLPSPTQTPRPILVAEALDRTPTARPSRTAAPTPSPARAVIEEPVLSSQVVSPQAPSPQATLGFTPPPAATASPSTAGDQPPVPLPVILLTAAGLLAILALLAARRRKLPRVGEGVVPFGRYAITGLLGAGRTSFVYDAREGKRAVALRVRRPDLPGVETDRFLREAAALERVRRLPADLPAIRLITRGAVKSHSASLEYLALEKLTGVNLHELSRSARRRLDPTLSVEILKEVAAALRRLREAGLTNDEIGAEDIFLLDPVPANAGNEIRLKVLGLCVGASDSRRDAAGLSGIAAELFRGKAASWEQDEWVTENVPTGLREMLIRARAASGESGASFEDLEKALRETTAGHGGSP